MKKIAKDKPILITGATGYVAGWIVKKLLDEGYTVHAAVRDPNNKEKLRYLNEIAEKSRGTLQYFKADLLQEGSYDEAMQGCELVFHTASPFTTNVKDPQKELLDPAVQGTRNVLNAVNRISSVKRVVLTSSCAAVIGDAKDFTTLPDGIATEEHWNFSSSLKHQPYSFSKVMAEKEAWKINKEQERWDMVVINPSLVIGPGINPTGTSESFNIIRQLGDGNMKAGVPKFFIGFVDVRDLAEAHFAAGFKPEAKGRHIISAVNGSLIQLSKILQKKFGDQFPFPKKLVPKFLVWLMAPMTGFKRKMVRYNVGYPWALDNAKSISQLGVKYRSLEESIVDFFQQMIDSGMVTSKAE